MEKLYREIVGNEAVITDETSHDELGEEALGACASVSSRSYSESEQSEPFSPAGSSGISVTSPASDAFPQLLQTDVPVEINPTMFSSPIRTRVIRIPGFSAKKAIPIVLGKTGFLRDASTGKIYLLKSAADGNAHFTTLSSPSIEEIAVDTAAALEDTSDCVDISSPISSETCEESRDDDAPQPLNLNGSFPCICSSLLSIVSAEVLILFLCLRRRGKENHAARKHRAARFLPTHSRRRAKLAPNPP